MGTEAVMVVGTRLFHESLAGLLEGQPGVTIVGGCRVNDAITAVGDRSPTAVVMELPARGFPALSYLSAFMKLRPAPRVVLVCRGLSREEIAAAAELSFDACVSEEDGREHLLHAVRAVLRSERYVGPAVSAILERRRAAPPNGLDENGMAGIVTDEERFALQQSFDVGAERATAVRLTPREREILTFIADGKTEPQIAGQLGLSPKTVHTHRTNIMHKLDVHNSVALVRCAFRLGLAEL